MWISRRSSVTLRHSYFPWPEPRAPERQSNEGQDNTGRQHLQGAKSEQHPPHRPQTLRLDLEPEHEQQQHDPDLGRGRHGCDVDHGTGRVRPEHDAHSDQADDRAEARPPRQDDRRRAGADQKDGRGEQLLKTAPWKPCRGHVMMLDAERATMRSDAARRLTGGASSPLGATPKREGTSFSLFSRDASGVELLLCDQPDDATLARAIRLDPVANRTYHYWHWHALVPGVTAG